MISVPYTMSSCNNEQYLTIKYLLKQTLLVCDGTDYTNKSSSLPLRCRDRSLPLLCTFVLFIYYIYLGFAVLFPCFSRE